jgi:hypothetical protein
MRRRVALIIPVLASLAACNPAPQASAPTADPTGFTRRLATVVLPPTPDDAQRRATQIAARPSATFNAPTLAITPTIYVGTFAGVEADEPSLPAVDPALFPGASTPVAPGLEACSQPPDPAFGTAWLDAPGLRDELGCPLEPATTTDGSAQPFERGVMWFRPPSDVWAIQTGGAYWHTAQPPAEPPWDTPAPDGLQIPVLGFGGVWKSSAAIRDALGYARAGETSSAITVQRFERGWLIRDGATGATWALVGSPDAGLVSGPY